MAFGILGGLVLQTPLGKLSDKLGRVRVIAGVSAGVSVCCIALVLIVLQVAEAKWLLAGAFAYGCLAFTVYSLAAAHANDVGDPSRRMQTSGALLAGFGIGAVVGPLASGTLMTAFGPSGLFMFNAVVTLGLTGLCLYRGRAYPAHPSPFVPQPGSQYTSSELYKAAQVAVAETSTGEKKPPERM
jgi:MFS family permease